MKPRAIEADDNWRVEFLARLAQLERTFGKGSSYSQRERDLILARVVPEWIVRGIRVGTTREQRARCEKALVALERLHAEVRSALASVDPEPTSDRLP